MNTLSGKPAQLAIIESNKSKYSKSEAMLIFPLYQGASLINTPILFCIDFTW